MQKRHKTLSRHDTKFTVAKVIVCVFLCMLIAQSTAQAEGLKPIEQHGVKIEWDAITAKETHTLGSGTTNRSMDLSGRLSIDEEKQFSAMLVELANATDESGKPLRQPVNIWSGRSPMVPQPNQFRPIGATRSRSSRPYSIYAQLHGFAQLPTGLDQLEGVIHLLEVTKTKTVEMELKSGETTDLAPDLSFSIESFGPSKASSSRLELRYTVKGASGRSFTIQGTKPFLWHYELRDENDKDVSGSSSAYEGGMLRFYPHSSGNKPTKAYLIFALEMVHRKIPFSLKNVPLKNTGDSTSTIQMPNAEALKKGKEINWSTLTLMTKLDAKTGEVTYPIQLSGTIPLSEKDKVLGVGKPTIHGLIRQDGKAITLDNPANGDSYTSSRSFSKVRLDSKGKPYPASTYVNKYDLTAFPQGVKKIVGEVLLAQADEPKVLETKSFAEGVQIDITKDSYFKIGKISTTGTRLRMPFVFFMKGSPFRLGEGDIYFSKIEMIDTAGNVYASQGYSYGHSKAPNEFIRGSGSTSFTLKADAKPAKLKLTVITPLRKVPVPFVIDLD